MATCDLLRNLEAILPAGSAPVAHGLVAAAVNHGPNSDEYRKVRGDARAAVLTKEEAYAVESAR
jgi:hypothetical protein